MGERLGHALVRGLERADRSRLSASARPGSIANLVDRLDGPRVEPPGEQHSPGDSGPNVVLQGGRGAVRDGRGERLGVP